jgi:hypothetical protein
VKALVAIASGVSASMGLLMLPEPAPMWAAIGFGFSAFLIILWSE